MARNGRKDYSSEFGDKKEQPRAPSAGRSIRQWISPYINQDDIEWLEGHRDDMAVIILNFLSELPEGYILSSKFDSYTDRWLTSCICSRSDDPNDGLAVTGRGATRIASVFTLVYLAAFKLEWAWMEKRGGISSEFG